MSPPRTDLLLYDGECGLCAASVQFVLSRDRKQAFVYAPLQSELAHEVLARHGQQVELNTFILVAGYESEGEAVHMRSRAAARVLLRLPGLWPVLGALLLATPRALADAGYDLVAKNRHRLFGPNRCLIPEPGYRSRFLA